MSRERTLELSMRPGPLSIQQLQVEFFYSLLQARFLAEEGRPEVCFRS